jgi:hypothetical protein
MEISESELLHPLTLPLHNLTPILERTFVQQALDATAIMRPAILISKSVSVLTTRGAIYCTHIAILELDFARSV